MLYFLNARRFTKFISHLHASKAWTHHKHSLQQVTSFGILWRKKILLTETFHVWLSWWQCKHALKKSLAVISFSQKYRIQFKVTNAWRECTRVKKYVQDLMVKASQLHAVQLFRKSFGRWKAWQANHNSKLNRATIIKEQISSSRCKKAFVQLKAWADLRKSEGKVIAVFTEMRKGHYYTFFVSLMCMLTRINALIKPRILVFTCHFHFL